MKRKHFLLALLAAAAAVFTAFAAGASAQALHDTTLGEASMTEQASGTFDVDIKPLELDGVAADSGLGRMSLDKQYHGDLEASGKGEMLTAMTEVEGSAGYVAIERVKGALHGRKGSFALQHRGVMTRGEPGLLITVVPDSGTGELEGISGQMNIRVEGGKHYYEFEYSLPE